MNDHRSTNYCRHPLCITTDSVHNNAQSSSSKDQRSHSGNQLVHKWIKLTTQFELVPMRGFAFKLLYYSVSTIWCHIIDCAKYFWWRNRPFLPADLHNGNIAGGILLSLGRPGLPRGSVSGLLFADGWIAVFRGLRWACVSRPSSLSISDSIFFTASLKSAPSADQSLSNASCSESCGYPARSRCRSPKHDMSTNAILTARMKPPPETGTLSQISSYLLDILYQRSRRLLGSRK